MSDDFFKAENIFVVVGATNDMSKYGAKVFKDLKDAGYNVIAINNRAWWPGDSGNARIRESLKFFRASH